MPKSFNSRFKKYTYNTCNDLKHLSGRDIIRLNPSTVSWDIMNTINTCNPEQKYALSDYLMMLKESKKRMTPVEYAKEVEEALSDFTTAIKGASKATFVDTAKQVVGEIQTKKASASAKAKAKASASAKAKGTRRRRNRNTKKKRKL